MNQKEQDYWTASKLSFKWQTKTRLVKMSESAITEIDLGFQPFGISARGDMVLITDYFAPAVCMNRVTIEGDTMKFEVAWIHGAWNGITRCRGGFPDMAYPSGANRCVTAFFAPDGKSVCIGRGDREFFLLKPQENAQWKIGLRISLPSSDEFTSVHSASFEHGQLLTVESNAACDKWRFVSYGWSGSGYDWRPGNEPIFTEKHTIPTPRFQYGVTLVLGAPVLVTGSHAVRGENAASSGIYVEDRIIVPGIVGSGICLLPNRGALVAQYGQEEEGAHKGNPGKLTYIPPALLASAV